jgi:hypothetical protein
MPSMTPVGRGEAASGGVLRARQVKVNPACLPHRQHATVLILGVECRLARVKIEQRMEDSSSSSSSSSFLSVFPLDETTRSIWSQYKACHPWHGLGIVTSPAHSSNIEPFRFS